MVTFEHESTFSRETEVSGKVTGGGGFAGEHAHELGVGFNVSNSNRAPDEVEFRAESQWHPGYFRTHSCPLHGSLFAAHQLDRTRRTCSIPQLPDFAGLGRWSQIHSTVWSAPTIRAEVVRAEDFVP